MLPSCLFIIKSWNYVHIFSYDFKKHINEVHFYRSLSQSLSKFLKIRHNRNFYYLNQVPHQGFEPIPVRQLSGFRGHTHIHSATIKLFKKYILFLSQSAVIASLTLFFRKGSIFDSINSFIGSRLCLKMKVRFYDNNHIVSIILRKTSCYLQTGWQ